MSNKRDINTGMEEILNSLDGVSRATPPPFLYARVMARLAKEATSTRWEKLASLISKPAFAIATIVLFLLINIAVVFHFSNTTASATQNDAAVVSDNEYHLSVSSLYDINPDQNDIAQK